MEAPNREASISDQVLRGGQYAPVRGKLLRQGTDGKVPAPSPGRHFVWGKKGGRITASRSKAKKGTITSQLRYRKAQEENRPLIDEETDLHLPKKPSPVPKGKETIKPVRGTKGNNARAGG